MEDKMKYIIDRIEDNIAILEQQDTKEFINISTNILPNCIKEGMILSIINNTYTIDIKATEKRKKEVLEKFKRLRSND